MRPLLLLILLCAIAGEAQAQKVVACRDRNMNIVACESGASGGGGGGGGMPGAGAMGAAAYGMGYAIGTFLRSLMVDDTDYEALARQEAEQQRRREENAARQREARRQDEARRAGEAEQRQQQFHSGQRDLLGQIRPLPGSGAGSTIVPLGPVVSSPGELTVRQLDLSAPAPQGALPQAQALQANRPDQARGDEAAHQQASKGFDTPQSAGGQSGPLMQVKGVPQPPPAPAPDPHLQPMSLQQRMLIAEGRKAQAQLDALRQRRLRGEIDADGYEREEAPLKAQIGRLAQQFAAAAPPPAEVIAASAPSPGAAPSPPVPPRGLNVIGAAPGLAVGTCFPSDPATIGCIEIRNTSEQRVRVYFQEVPGVFCTIEPGSMCSRPATQGVYNGFAERDDGRRTTLATLLHTPAGVRWAIQFP